MEKIMQINKSNIEEYKKIVKKNKPKPEKSHLVMSFLVGGAICIIGQIINDFFIKKGLVDYFYKPIKNKLYNIILFIFSICSKALHRFAVTV